MSEQIIWDFYVKFLKVTVETDYLLDSYART